MPASFTPLSVVMSMDESVEALLLAYGCRSWERHFWSPGQCVQYRSVVDHRGAAQLHQDPRHHSRGAPQFLSVNDIDSGSRPVHPNALHAALQNASGVGMQFRLLGLIGPCA